MAAIDLRVTFTNYFSESEVKITQHCMLIEFCKNFPSRGGCITHLSVIVCTSYCANCVMLHRWGTIRHVIEKIFWSLLPKAKKLTFLILPRKKVKSKDFRLFEVKDHKRLVSNTICCCFWDFCNILNHITGV